MNVFTAGMIQACQIADCLPQNFIYIVNLFLLVTYMVGREERKMLFMSYSCKLCEFSNRHQAKPPMCPKDLGIEKCISGGLIVVGSYVPKTTKQVEELKSQFGHNLKIIEALDWLKSHYWKPQKNAVPDVRVEIRTRLREVAYFK